MKHHDDTLWGIHNYGILVCPTIQPTRRAAISYALSLSVPDAGEIQPTEKNLKKHCPYYRAVKLSISWDEDKK